MFFPDFEGKHWNVNLFHGITHLTSEKKSE